MDEMTQKRLKTLEKKMSVKAMKKALIREELEKQIHAYGAEENLPKMPYANYDEIRQIKSLNHRFILADDHVPSATEKGFEVPDDFISPLVTATWAAAQYITIQMRRQNIDRKYASAMSGIDTSLFTRYQNFDRPFTPTPANLSCFCQNVMHESCHKVMFGEEGKIVLPYVYSMIFKDIGKLSSETINELLAQARKIQYEYETENPSKIINGPHRNQLEMLRERMEDLAIDVGRPCMFLFRNEEATEPINKRLYATLFSIFADDESKHHEPTLPTLMYFSFETRYALDYFVSENFVKYCPIYVRKGKKEVRIINSQVLELIGICFEVDKERRAKILSDIFAAVLE